MRAKLGIDDDAMVLLNVGRFEEQKNQEHLIDIFGNYVRKNKTAKLVIIGEGSLKHNLTMPSSANLRKTRLYATRLKTQPHEATLRML